MSNINHTTFSDQLGPFLQLTRKPEAIWRHWALNTDADFNRRKIKDNLADDVNDEASAENAGINDMNVQVPLTVSLFGQMKSTFEKLISPILDEDIPTSPEDKAVDIASYDHDVLTDGSVSLTRRTGRLGALHQAFLDDGKVILENTVTLGALVKNTQNQGDAVVIDAPLGSDHTLSGVLFLRCDSDIVGATTFDVSIELTDRLVDTATIVAANQITLNRSYQDGPTGLTQLKLGLGTATVVDPNSLVTGTPTVTNENATDTFRGQVFLKVTRQTGSPEWLIEIFNRSPREPSQKRGSKVVTGTVGTEALSILLAAGMTLNFTFDKAAADADMPNPGDTNETVLIDIQNPREGDEFSFTVSNDEVGQFATKLAHIHRASLPSGPVPSGEYTDSKADSIPIT